MAHVLLAAFAPTPHERAARDAVRARIEAASHRVDVADLGGDPASLRRAIEANDAIVAILDGAPLSGDIVWCVAVARQLRRPILGLRSDTRSEGLPSLLRAELADLVRVEDWEGDAWAAKTLEFLSGVRVFAGNLVRDSVPKILKEEGRELRFRQVDSDAYPPVLKRKIVEMAQRLEEAEFGLEQEQVADVLELLETLINLRQYDRESLRSIKEGKWRKRGGFQKGYLLEEEPPLSSR